MNVEIVTGTVEATLRPIIGKLGAGVLVPWEESWQLSLLCQGLAQWELHVSGIASRPSELKVRVSASEE